MAASDVSLSHTIDDDITFERVRHMPRRTQFVSTHRKLSWQYDKQVKQHERDQKLSHVELARAKTAMAEKFSRLQDAKKEAERKKGEPGAVPDRRLSVDPCLTDTELNNPARLATSPGMKHSHSASSFTEVAMTPEDAETDQPDRRVVAATKAAQPGRAGRRATIAEGVTDRTSLPPHLVRRLSQFMDSTSALLLSSPCSSSGRRRDSHSTATDRVPDTDLPEQPEPETEYD